MDIINQYLSMKFSELPKTNELLVLKKDIEKEMVEKYEALLKDGKDESEALSSVLIEYNHIDERLKNFTSNQIHNDKDDLPNKNEISKNQIEAFLKFTNKRARVIALGVFLCIIAGATLIFTESIAEFKFPYFKIEILSSLSLIPVLILVAIAVAFFVSISSEFKDYDYIMKSTTALSPDSETFLRNQFNNFKKKARTNNIIGIILCILSPISIFIGDTLNEFSENIGVVILLIIVSIAVYIFVKTNIYNSTLKFLLSPEKRALSTNSTVNTIKSSIVAIVWLIAVALYFFLGFTTFRWDITWLIFLIAAAITIAIDNYIDYKFKNK
ncbi:MAG: hypothetical protein ACRDD2_09685 [Sarcina sp.]